jgi:hypothetical protein
LSLLSDRAPRGATLKPYGEGICTERKAYRGEKAPVAGGPEWSGGVSSSIREPPLAKRYTLGECDVIVLPLRLSCQFDLSLTRYYGPAHLRGMHGLHAILGFFPPAAVGARIEMGH